MEKPRILIVEDEDSIVALLRAILSAYGYNVCGAIATGAELADIVRETHPDLVLMDVFLDGRIDGVTTAECIHRVADIPVVFVGDFPTHSDKVRGMQQSGYIAKPFKLREVLHVVEKALAGSNLC